MHTYTTYNTNISSGCLPLFHALSHTFSVSHFCTTPPGQGQRTQGEYNTPLNSTAWRIQPARTISPFCAVWANPTLTRPFPLGKHWVYLLWVMISLQTLFCTSFSHYGWYIYVIRTQLCLFYFQSSSSLLVILHLYYLSTLQGCCLL